MNTQNEPLIYQIRIRLKGHLGSQWKDWFDGLTITLEDSGDTILSGRVTDQTALYGLLKKVRDLGIRLISMICVESTSADVSDINSLDDR